MTMRKKEIKKRVNITLDDNIKQSASTYAKERYNTSLSGLITALLTDFNKKESYKKVDHIDQGSLI